MSIMKLTQELKGVGSRSVIAVLTGNGKTELYVLKPFSQKYDGSEKVLFLPQPPLPLRPDCGLAALKAVKVYSSKYRIAHTLLLIDREYVHREETGKEIEGALRGFGINVQNVKSPQKLKENAFIINGMVGSRPVIIHVVVQGEEKCLEEDIAKLVYMELGIVVEPKKKAIRTALHKRGLNTYTLVANALKRNLNRAFPALAFIIEEIEKNDIK